MRHYLSIFFIAMGLTFCYAGSHHTPRSKGFPVFPAIKNSQIPGAPLLGQPMLITGTQEEIRTEKHGLAYPAFFDWNHDGKTDLLLGEFETGQTGSNIKVYLNTGTNAKPSYTGKYFYATDIQGDTITNHQWCCIGIHPRFVDLDKDGYTDMLSGQYNPGLISWWRGSKTGFQPRVFIDQAGLDSIQNAPFSTNQLNIGSPTYWTYSSAGFADFNADGKDDLFVGGFGEFRVALNTGTTEKPQFGKRTYLLGLDGNPLSVIAPTKDEIELARKRYDSPNYSGVIKSFVTPYDWDGDGVLDLLVTHAYGDQRCKDPITFFRGLRTDKGLRFEAGKPLFTTADGRKIFPGCQPNLTITDYNHDGIPDLVIGLSIPTINGFDIDSLTTWSYIKELGIEYPGKDAGRVCTSPEIIEKIKAKMSSAPGMKSYYLGKLKDEKYLTLRHRGYVYLMLGKKNPVMAATPKTVIAQPEKTVPVNKKTVSNDASENNLKIIFEGLGAINPSSQCMKLTARISLPKESYVYANDNNPKKVQPIKVEFILPEGFKTKGDISTPEINSISGESGYTGSDLMFSQPFEMDLQSKIMIKPGDYKFQVKVSYQLMTKDGVSAPKIEVLELSSYYFFY